MLITASIHLAIGSSPRHQLVCDDETREGGEVPIGNFKEIQPTVPRAHVQPSGAIETAVHYRIEKVTCPQLGLHRRFSQYLAPIEGTEAARSANGANPAVIGAVVGSFKHKSPRAILNIKRT